MILILVEGVMFCYFLTTIYIQQAGMQDMQLVCYNENNKSWEVNNLYWQVDNKEA